MQKRYESLLPRERRLEVRDALLGQFKNHRFDTGLEKAAEILDQALAAAPVAADQRALVGRDLHRGQAGGGKFGLGTLLAIGLGIFGVLLLLRVLGGLFNRGGGYPAQMGMGGMNRPGMGPGYGGQVMDTVDLAAAASSPGCSAGWAEPWPETGFMTSSRAGTAALDIPTPPRTSPARPLLPTIPAATPSSVAMTMAARELPGAIREVAMQAAAGAAAMAAATGAVEVVTGAAEVVTGAAEVVTEEVGDPLLPCPFSPGHISLRIAAFL